MSRKGKVWDQPYDEDESGAIAEGLAAEPLDDPAAEAIRRALHWAAPYYIDILRDDEYADLAVNIVFRLDGWKLVRSP